MSTNLTIASRLIAFVAALGAAGCAASSPPPSPASALAPAQLAEQRRAAIESAGVRQQDYLKGLAAAVKQEKRDEAWAQKKESALRASYAADARAPRGALKSVDCRSSKCDLQFQAGAQKASPKAVIEQSALSQWIAAHEPCGYTIATQQQGTTEIFIDCGR